MKAKALSRATDYVTILVPHYVCYATMHLCQIGIHAALSSKGASMEPGNPSLRLQTIERHILDQQERFPLSLIHI